MLFAIDMSPAALVNSLGSRLLYERVWRGYPLATLVRRSPSRRRPRCMTRGLKYS